MSINQSPLPDKPFEDTILEEEFDIVPVGESTKTSLKTHILNILILILVASASFGIGRITTIKNGGVPVTIESIKPVETVNSSVSQATIKQSANTAAVVTAENGEVVASKNGSKYHYPWCPGAQQISPQNKITFRSIEEAKASGYSPAANCKGLK